MKALLLLFVPLVALGAALDWDSDDPPGNLTKETCTIEGAAFLDAGTFYLAREVPCLRRPDGGLILPRWPLRADRLPVFTIFNKELVTENATGCDAGICDSDSDDAGTPQTLPRLLQCACRNRDAGAGFCRYTLADGGLVLAPFAETLGPGYPKTGWTGLGCERKACVELQGFDSMPAACQ